MPHTIDLRKRPEPEPKLEPEPELGPEPAPAPERVVEQRPAVSTEEAESRESADDGIAWVTSLSRVPSKKTAVLLAVLLTVSAGAVLFMNRDLMFAAVLVLAGILFVISSFKDPVYQQVRIDTSGVTVQDRRYFYSEIKSFWISYEPAVVKELSLELKKKYTQRIRIPLENINPLEVRRAMVTLVPEKEYEESIIDQIARKLNI